MKNHLDQVGLWACQWGVVLIVYQWQVIQNNIEKEKRVSKDPCVILSAPDCVMFQVPALTFPQQWSINELKGEKDLSPLHRLLFGYFITE